MHISPRCVYFLQPPGVHYVGRPYDDVFYFSADRFFCPLFNKQVYSERLFTDEPIVRQIPIIMGNLEPHAARLSRKTAECISTIDFGPMSPNIQQSPPTTCLPVRYNLFRDSLFSTTRPLFYRNELTNPKLPFIIGSDRD